MKFPASLPGAYGTGRYPCEVRLTMLGTRGVPASYSGFETCVEQVGKRLAARGHRVLVYCRAGQPGAADGTYLGMERVVLPAIRTKGLETLTHSALSTAHALIRDHPDAAVVFGVGNAVYARALRMAHIPAAINVDGADWARRKWGGLGRRYLRWSESTPKRRPRMRADHHRDGLAPIHRHSRRKCLGRPSPR